MMTERYFQMAPYTQNAFFPLMLQELLINCKRKPSGRNIAFNYIVRAALMNKAVLNKKLSCHKSGMPALPFIIITVKRMRNIFPQPNWNS